MKKILKLFKILCYLVLPLIFIMLIQYSGQELP